LPRPPILLMLIAHNTTPFSVEKRK